MKLLELFNGYEKNPCSLGFQRCQTVKQIGSMLEQKDTNIALHAEETTHGIKNLEAIQEHKKDF